LIFATDEAASGAGDQRLTGRHGERIDRILTEKRRRTRRQRELLLQWIELRLARALEFFANDTPDNHLEALGPSVDVFV
jgi:hypothetical protein